MTRDELKGLKAGDRVTVTDGFRTWTAEVVRVTPKQIHTTGRTFSREDGVANMYSFRPDRIVGSAAK